MTRSLAPALAALAVVYAACLAIAATPMAAHSLVAAGIAFDLTITATAAFWWLAVRPGHAKPGSLLRVAALGFAAAKLLVGLGALGAAGVLAELIALAWLALRIRRIARRSRELRRLGHGLPSALDAAFTETLRPRALASALAIETSAVILAVTGWFRRRPAGYSMHERSGVLLILGVLVALAFVESVVTHIVLAHWSPTAAVVASILSAYGLLWILGAAHAIRLSPLRFIGSDLVIERGFRARALVPFSQIASATPIASKLDGALDLAYSDPNLLLTFCEPVAVRGLFGRTRLTDRLTLSVDDRDGFIAALSRS